MFLPLKNIILRSLKSCRPGFVSGFTLVELLVYMTIFSLVSIGVTTLVLQMKTTQIKAQNFVEDTHAEDIAIQRIQIQLGKSDAVRIDNVTAGDRACLRLERDKSQRRLGYNFNGLNQYFTLAGAPNFSPALNSPRTISAWIFMPSLATGKNTLVSWGMSGSAGQNIAQKTALEVNNGNLNFNSGCGGIEVGGKDLRDARWHHVAFTYRGVGGAWTYSSKLYLDGQPQNQASFSSGSCEFSAFFTSLYTKSENFSVGADKELGDGHFDGVIADLRIISEALTEAQIQNLYQRDEAFLDAMVNKTGWQGQYYHWPMTTHTAGTSAVPVDTKGMTSQFGWQGAGGKPAMFETIVDDKDYHSFCFLDEDKDKKFELWESDSATTVPATAGQAGWKKRSDDVFIPSANGFFTAIGNNPESVVGNFAVGRLVGGSSGIAPADRSKSLSTRRKTRHAELCVIAPTLSVNTTSCSFSSAYIAIEDYSQNIDGDIGLLHAQKSVNGDITTYSNLLNMPANVVGRWHDKTGIFRLSTTDKTPLPSKLWRRALKQATYQPLKAFSQTSRSFVISLGGVPYKQGSTFHFYDFVPATTANHTYSLAKSQAEASSGNFCGTPSYLTTITSNRENQHIERVFTEAEGGWPDGWIGATANANSTDRAWSWDTGPDKGKIFWYHYGLHGWAARDNATATPVKTTQFTRKAYDHQPDVINNQLKRDIIDKQGRALRYSNFSFGTPSDNCNQGGTKTCEPVVYGGINNVAIQGSDGDGGLCYSHPATNNSVRCASKSGTSAYSYSSICGHFREFSGIPATEPTATLAESVTVDMQRFNDFCQK